MQSEPKPMAHQDAQRTLIQRLLKLAIEILKRQSALKERFGR